MSTAFNSHLKLSTWHPTNLTKAYNPAQKLYRCLHHPVEKKN